MRYEGGNVADWLDILIRENKTPGNIAAQSIKTPSDHRRIRGLVESFESAENDITNNKDISDKTVSTLIRRKSIDLDNVSRLLEALKEKYEQSPLIVLSHTFNTLLDNFTKNVDTYNELEQFINEKIEYISERRSDWKMDFQQRVKYTNKEELLENLETVMRQGNINNTTLTQLINLLPNITRNLIIADRENRPNIKTETNYLVAPLEQFIDILKSNKVTLEKFNDLFRYLSAEGWLTQRLRFYTTGVKQGEFDVRSPMYTLFKILKFKEDEYIFSVSSEGALMGRMEQVSDYQPKLYRLFISDYLSGKIVASKEEETVTPEESQDYIGLSYEDKKIREDEVIQRIKLRRTDPTSLKPLYDAWLQDHEAFMGSYTKTEDKFKQMFREKFQNNIDKSSIFTLSIPFNENEGTAELTNFLTDNVWPSNVDEASPKMILKAYLYVMDNFSKLGYSNVQTEKLLRQLREIVNAVRELEYSAERYGKTEIRKLFEHGIEGIRPQMIESLTGIDNINKLIEAFITDFKQAILETSDAICKSIHSAIEENIEKKSQKQYTISTREEPKLVRDEKIIDGRLVATGKVREKGKDAKGKLETTTRTRGTFHEWLADIGDLATRLIVKKYGSK